MKSSVFLGSLGIATAAVVIGQIGAHSGEGDGNNIYDIASACGVGQAPGGFSQFGSIGTYPNGTVALGLLTIGQNQGNIGIPWNAVPQVSHPVISQNFYRITADGRLEQIGQAWLKHAWFALQQSLCGFNCQSGGNGSLLGINCADTYGASLNADQGDLGPRYEIEPHALRWMDGLTWTGSRFQTGPPANNAVQRRLRVRHDDLNDTASGVTYWYEAQYNMLRNYGNQNHNDMIETSDRIFNNARHRRTIVSNNGANFTFSNSGGDVNGPIIQAWGDVRSMATPTDDGVVYVSSRAVDIGGGNFRYEFCVMNFTLDTEVEAISIPTNGANVSNVGFHQTYDGYWTDATTFVNESPYDAQPWDSTVDGDSISFSAQAPEGGALPNTIRWSTMYTFWFDADAPPLQGGTDMTITPREQGSVAELTAGITAPGAPGIQAPLTDVATTFGEQIGGDLSSLLASDNVRYSSNSSFGFTASEPHVSQIAVGATSPVQVADGIIVTIESRLNQSGGTRRVRLRNYDGGGIVTIDTYPIGSTEITVESSVTGGASQFIRNSDARIEIISRTSAVATFSASGFISRYDLVKVEVTE